MAATIKNLPKYMMNEMNAIKKSLSQYSGYKDVASSLGKFTSQDIVAGLIGCIIPESGSNHTILNTKEYKGKGAKGTHGWNCGEGLLQWTFWKYKSQLIKDYNADSESTQKLPTTWEEYKKGTPIERGGKLFAVQDGRHISGLTLDNQMLFLTKYYSGLINSLQNETRLEVIVAKIYQKKAGMGFYPELKHDPVLRAYKTSKEQYPSSAGNHYLQSLKIANEYLKVPVTPIEVAEPVNDYSVPLNAYEEIKETPTPPIIIESIGSNVKNKKNKPVGTILGSHMRQK